jgi:hypothetical protein
MMNRVIFALSGVFWAVMMGWLLRIDVLPKYEVYDAPGYDAVVRDVQAPVTRDMVVYQGNEEVGTSHTILTPAADGSTSIVNVTNLDVKVAVFESRVSCLMEIRIGVDKELDKIMLNLSAGEKHADVAGRRIGKKIRMVIRLNGERFFQDIPYTSGMISSYFEPFGLGARLKVGQEWHTRFLDPLSQGTTDALVKVVGRETLTMALRKNDPPKPIEAYKVVMTAGTMQLNAWATEDGSILKEETPLGYTLVYRESEDYDPNQAGVQKLRAQAGSEGLESGD